MVLLIGLAGSIGAVCRYYLSTWIQQKFNNKFPFATFIVNAIGCLLMGIWYGLYESQLMNLTAWQVLSLGFLGAFTTFSTFSYEVLTLYRKSKQYALLYLFCSFIVALLFAILGYSIIN